MVDAVRSVRREFCSAASEGMKLAYLPDLSEYDYIASCARPGTKAVGWLDVGHDFERASPDAGILDALWEFCRTSVAQTRGWHSCPFCESDVGLETKRRGESLLLGTSEIRVFSSDGQTYAAPTLIFHYVADHHYQPPAEFTAALLHGPRPGSQQYFAWLRRLDLEWNDTSTGGQGYWDPDASQSELDDQTPLLDLMARPRPDAEKK